MNRLTVFALLLVSALFHFESHASFFSWLSPSHQPSFAQVKKIWVFNTEFTGEYATRMAVAETFPNAEIQSLSLPDGKDPIDPKAFMVANGNEFPDLIVHSFSNPRETDFILSIKKRSKGKTFTVCLDDPKSRQSEWDLIVSPRHLPPVVGRNVFRTVGVPSRVTPERLKQAEEEWKETFAHLPRPIIAVFVGGQTQERVFSRVNAKDLATYATEIAKANHGSLVVTNSRRTSALATSFFLSAVTSVPFFFYDVRNADEPNPYYGMLAYADYIVTTGDSLSMVSDAASTGKPVYVFAPPTTIEDRHKNLISDLFQSGRVRAPSKELEHWSYLPLHTAEQIKTEISRRRGHCEPLLD